MLDSLCASLFVEEKRREEKRSTEQGGRPVSGSEIFIHEPMAICSYFTNGVKSFQHRVNMKRMHAVDVCGVRRERLGSKADGINAIKTHQWFAGFDWGGVQAGEYYNQVRLFSCRI